MTRFHVSLILRKKKKSLDKNNGVLSVVGTIDLIPLIMVGFHHCYEI